MTIGIRPRILLTFVACFALMAAISLGQLQRSLNQSYDEIERRDLVAHMGRVVQSVESSLSHLNNQTRDWAVWSAMYDFAVQPNATWAAENIGAQAMEPAALSLVMIYDAKGQLLSMTTRNRQGGALRLPTLSTSPYLPLFKAATRADESNCGLIKTDAELMLMCRANIVRSDGTGDFVGTVVLGRQLDSAFTSKLQEQTRLVFELHTMDELPPGLMRWPGHLSIMPFGTNDFWTSHDEKEYRAYYRLRDVLHADVGFITLNVARDVHEEGEKLYRHVRQQIIWSGIILGAILSLAVHFLLIRRLRRFTTQLVTLTEESSWHTRVSISGQDELGLLSRKVNELLGVIESQVERLEALSLTDTLTGLPNRRAFDSRLALEYSRKERNKRPLAMLMLDIDHFKRYNDHYGHPAGDAALKGVADVLRVAVCRRSDLVARLGGEEFAVLLPETGPEQAMQIANRIRRVSQGRDIPHEDSPVAPYMTFSIGIAIAGAESPEAFVNRVDLALYEAKHSGRNRAYCDPLT